MWCFMVFLKLIPPKSDFEEGLPRFKQLMYQSLFTVNGQLGTVFRSPASILTSDGCMACSPVNSHPTPVTESIPTSIWRTDAS